MSLTEKTIDKIETMIAEEMAKMKVGGLSLAIVGEDEILYSNGIGAKNLDKNLPADIDTIYNIASVSKVVTCTAIMILADEGKLSIDDPASKYIPLKLGDPSNPITIKHLMNHTSGIPNLAGDTFTYRMNKVNLKPRESAKLVPMSSKSDFYRIINNGEEYCHATGEYFHYNNYAYTMLGLIIEEITGQVFTEFIKERIFEPLGMSSSSFDPDDFKDNENLAVGYHAFPPKEGGKIADMGRWQDRWEFLAAGGMYSSVRDLSVFMQMLMGMGKRGDVRIINEESAAIMQDDSLVPGTMAKKFQASFTPNQSRGYGFGLFVDADFYGRKNVNHGGNMFGGTADFTFLPGDKLGIVSLANNFVGPRPIIGSALALLAGVEEDKIHYLVEKKHYKILNGIYESYNEGERIKVSGVVANLTISSTEEHIFSTPPMIILPLENNDLQPMEFFVRNPGGGRFIIFFEDIDGQLWLNIERSRYKRIGPI